MLTGWYYCRGATKRDRTSLTEGESYLVRKNAYTHRMHVYMPYILIEQTEHCAG